VNVEKITEAEIVDVLMGGASPELVERVKAAMAADPHLAAKYDDWARFMPVIHKQTVPMREMVANVRQRVHERLPFEYPALYTQSLEPLEQGRFSRPPRVMFFHRTWVKASMAAAAALAVALVSAYLMMGGPNLISRAGNSGHAELTGDRYAFSWKNWNSRRSENVPNTVPAEQIAPGQSSGLVVNRVAVRVRDGAQVQIGVNEVIQNAGTVAYEAPAGVAAGALSVRIPEGVVQGMEGPGSYEISVMPGKSTFLQAYSGRVKIMMGQQGEVNLQAGEMVSLQAGQKPVLVTREK